MEGDRLGTGRAGRGVMAEPSDFGTLKTLAVGDITGDFFVPAYQRGYRWGVHEVLQLLNDIRESNGATYYLQPVVVRRRDDDSWELIDGQQRLTTLYLIFQYLKRRHLPAADPHYSITYETREESKEWLERLDKEAADSNIDFFHLAQAYNCIESWLEGFEHRATHEATRLYGYLFEGVQVLWYEAPKEVDSSELFRRLNVGRIPLTDAELVKALLLSRSQGEPGYTSRAQEIAAHWDGFERDLRVPEVWAFVTGEAESQATHISLLLDTLAGGPQGRERPLFHTFETLKPRIEQDSQAFWNEVVDLHSLVLGWYEDRDLYHKVGYLIAVGVSFQELVELCEGKGRSAFESALDEKIRRRLNLSFAELADLTYTSAKSSDVLLLMNVETIRRMRDSSERYSFKAHAGGSWSLEHIHAQSAEVLNKAEQWVAWLNFHRTALQDLPHLDESHRADLTARIDHALTGDVTSVVFNELGQELTGVFSTSDEGSESDVHAISNLALLDHGDNSALSNSVFEVKRRLMIQRDKVGSYLPVCTRNIFLKYYTDSAAQQLHFWSRADREAYFNAMADVIGAYLQSEERDE
jgi:hypothetical protein